jgi:hypothetical protein
MVPAHSNKFTNGENKTQSLRTLFRRPNGTTYTESETHRKSYIRRQNKTKNKVRIVKGIPWRDPSSYSRCVAQYSHNSGEWTNSNNYFVQGYKGDNNTERSFLGGYIGTLGYLLDSEGSVDGGLISDYKNRARIECLLKLADNKIQLGQFLAESIKSADMVAGGLKDFAQLLLDVKHGRLNRIPQRFKWPGWNKGSKSLANGWLAWNYGWKPLATDLYASYQISKDGLGKEAKVISAVRNLRNTQSVKGTTTYYEVEGEVRLHNRCKITAKVSDSFLQKATGIGVINPLSLGWELVPYSFVVDWVCPIGNYLEALSAHAGLDFIGGFESQVARSNVRCTYQTPSGHSGTMSSIDRESLHFIRNKLSDFPGIVPYVKSPWSKSHVTSAIALLRKLF